LVADAVQLLCEAASLNSTLPHLKVLLMIGAGVVNRDVNERLTARDKVFMKLIRMLIPPHTDNAEAAEYLRLQIGQDHPRVQWVAIRPYNLIDEAKVTSYCTNASPNQSVIFDPKVTSRINVADFMCNLISDSRVWDQWKGKMPVIYNDQSPSAETLDSHSVDP
jgi:hypothetical protein